MLNDLAAICSAHVLLFTGSTFVLGLIVGSFLNVVIHRLPIILEREWRAQAFEHLPESVGAATVDPGAGAVALQPGDLPSDASQPISLSLPRSACPTCKAPISALQNIPVVSWLALRGRCASCKSRISVRYPVVEIATGLLSAAVAYHLGFSAQAACGVVLTWALIALTGIDVDHQLLPDNITLPLMWTGLLASIVIDASPATPLPVSPRDAIIGATAGYVSLWLVFHAFRLITGKEGMGYGDFKLFAALGAWLGWKLLPLIILLSAATGAILGILMILLRVRDRAAPMPFGPYLAAAGWIAMMYGDEIIGGYIRLSGLQH